MKRRGFHFENLCAPVGLHRPLDKKCPATAECIAFPQRGAESAEPASHRTPNPVSPGKL